MKRRDFLFLCGGGALLASANPGWLLAAEAEPEHYGRARLVTADGQPLAAAQLAGTGGYIFHYPYVSTPALVLDLGRKVPGGVGATGGIVAFSAICSHQFAHPKAALSAINYHPGANDAPGRINCCLHGSGFDPARGGAVVAGPAPTPLTAIVLAQEGDALVALGTRGPEVYGAFFDSFKRELRKQYGRSGVKQMAEGDATAVAAQDYSAQRVMC
jgi:arsenite oxidase small subunit